MNRVVVHFRLRGLAAVLVASCVIVAACSSGSSSRSTSTSRAAGVVTTAVGVGVSGAFGAAPKLTVPATRAPVILTQQTISLGRGATVAKGDTVVVNYVGPVSYTHLRAHETDSYLVCRLLLEKK